MLLCTMEVVSYTSIICMILVYVTSHYDQPNSLLVHVPPIKEHANLFVTATLVKRGRCLVEVLHNQEQV